MTYPLYSRAFFSLLLAQFLSALADNAVFIAAIATIKLASHASSYSSLVQAAFLIAYIVLAPFTGPYADGRAKANVMFVSNSVKIIGSVLMTLGFDPLISYALIGVGAAAYSPAKYGILIELLPKEQLIKANSYLESTTIIAILLGVFIGGIVADHSLTALFWLCTGLYFMASLINLLIPKTPIVKTFSWKQLGFYGKNYFHTVAQFYRQVPARISIIGTTSFWSTGITLRLILFAWIPFMFHNTSNELPANLMGFLSIGIVIGAIIAALWIDDQHTHRALRVGLLLGPLVIAICFIHHLPLLFAFMILIGACGGIFMIPLNATIQEQGQKTIGTGSALAVQNFCESAGMVSFTLLYGLMQKLSIPLPAIVIGLGIAIFLIIAMLNKTAKANLS